MGHRQGQQEKAADGLGRARDSGIVLLIQGHEGLGYLINAYYVQARATSSPVIFDHLE